MPVEQPMGNAAMLYDAERNALIVVVGQGAYTRILRYVVVDDSWQLQAQSNAEGALDVALSYDGSRLLVLRSPNSPPSAMDELDPVTLQVLASTSLPNSQSGVSEFALANDGQALVFRPGGDLFLYGVATRTSKYVAYDGGVHGVAASGNGSFAAFLGYTSYVYDTVAGLLQYRSADAATATSVDDAGIRYLSRSVIFDAATLRATGVLFPNTLDLSSVASAISHDGARAYVVDSLRQLHTYDLTQQPGGPDPQYPRYPEVGDPVPLPGSESSTYSWSPMLVTPDDAYVVISGKTEFWVMPAPR